MDESSTNNTSSKSSRPIRNRRYSRKTSGIGHKTIKRLFTPEIKRYLKDWLVRRRDNPYPNRDEKKVLAVETGLTYTQICNWFANWRRKLKNASGEQNKKTWGHLIKSYNTQARGNVEQFSICSDDSIWGENDPAYADNSVEPTVVDHCYTAAYPNKSKAPSQKCYSQFNAQCYHVSSTTEECKARNPGNKYKNHIIEKYLKGLQLETESSSNVIIPALSRKGSPPVILSKWLESAANFQPCRNNYAAWNLNGRKRNDKKNQTSQWNLPQHYDARQDINLYDKALDYRNKELIYDTCAHGKEEVEAAVTLTRLASLHRS